MTIKVSGQPLPQPIVGTSLALLAQGCKGRVEIQNVSPSTRAAGGGLPLAAAATDAGITVIGQLDIELELGSMQQAGNRGLASSTPQLMVPVRKGVSYAALHVNEKHEPVWLFPVAYSKHQSALVLPVADNMSLNGTRGPGTMMMRCLVTVVCWAISPITHSTAKKLSKYWEADKRPYEMQQVQPDGNFKKPCWESFSAGPALLLIHGTFSTPKVGFAGWLGTAAFEATVDRYQGRVLALGHPSLSASLKENIDWLLQQLPPHVVQENTFDIVSHSRGGLVARELVSRVGQGPRIERVCQIGTPNEGTPLANIKHWTKFLNAHTHCLNSLPDTVTTVMLEALLCIVKIIGDGITGGLPGLQEMNPTSPWLKNRSISSDHTTWFTVGAAYKADQGNGGLISQLKGSAIDKFFVASNDLVVPSLGCHQSVRPPTDSLVLEGAEVNHCNYFQSATVHAALSRWLS